MLGKLMEETGEMEQGTGRDVGRKRAEKSNPDDRRKLRRGAWRHQGKGRAGQEFPEARDRSGRLPCCRLVSTYTSVQMFLPLPGGLFM